MWQSLGFEKNPYDANPLEPCKEDADLLVGRSKEMVRLCTAVESQTHGAYVISGPPGVGKTSFFNVTQYLLEAGLAPSGPRMLAARTLCAIQPTDSPRDVARRAVEKVVKSIELYCAINNLAVPSETKTISKWINTKGNTALDVGITIFNFGGSIGRSVELPPFGDTSFERLRDVLLSLLSEIETKLNRSGAFVVLDNIENLEDDHLMKLLLTFRDTLFTVPNLWWIIIGQSGLGSLIHAREPRVFERLSGIGLELEPISKVELHEAIGLRVNRFHRDGEDKAPLPKDVHDHLYRASHGEIRFVFKYSSEICFEFVSIVKIRVMRNGIRKISQHDLDERLGQLLVQHQIPGEHAESVLRQLIHKEITSLNLRKKEIDVLRMIGDYKGARASQFKNYSLRSAADFSSNYLVRFYKQSLLTKRQEGRSVMYQLRGVAALAWEYKLLISG